MSTRWHIGAKHLRGAIAAYAKRFDLLEVRIAHPTPGEADVVPGPSLATLKRWRKSVPPAFDFAVVAGPHLSRVKASPALDKELDAAREAIDALQARCFVLRTPPDVTPTSLWRDRIAKIVSRMPARRDALRVGAERGLGGGGRRLAGARMGGRAGARSGARARAARAGGLPAHAGAGRDAVVRSDRARAHREGRGRAARGLRHHRDGYGAHRGEAPARARTARPSGARRAGASRLVRPRGDIIVRDDEQE